MKRKIRTHHYIELNIDLNHIIKIIINKLIITTIINKEIESKLAELTGIMK